MSVSPRIRDITSRILYEDTDLIVCVKPTGIPTQSDRTGTPDLQSLLLGHLVQQRRAGADQGIPYLAVVHRLDRPVGGILVFAKTKQAAAALSEQIRIHQMTKRYLCVLTGQTGAEACEENKGDEPADSQLKKPGLCSREDVLTAAEYGWRTCVDFLAVDKRTNLSRFVPEGQGQKAELSYRVLEEISEQDPVAFAENNGSNRNDLRHFALTEVELKTGRHHQIRLQMTRVRHGIAGDTKYNPDYIGRPGWHELALFSHFLQFIHPRTGEILQFTAAPEADIYQKFSKWKTGK